MKRNTLKFMAFAISALMCASCTFIRVTDVGSLSGTVTVEGKGEIVSKSFEVDEFDKINVSSIFSVHYEMTDGEPSVEIEANENLFEYIKIETNDDGCLKLSLNKVDIKGDAKINAYVKSSSLHSIELAGAGNIICENPVETDELFIKLAGAGKIEMDGLVAENASFSIAGAADAEIEDIECATLEAKIAGAGEMEITGKAGSADFSIAGAGKIDIRELECPNVKKEIAGVGSILD